MSGVLAISYLLTHSSGLQALVPAARIMPGDLPLKLDTPAINVEHADGMPRNTLSMLEPNRTWRDVVQVNAHVSSPAASVPGLGYPGLSAIMAQIMAACPNQRGTVNGVSVLAILPDMRGPYLVDLDSARISQSQDFIVYWKT